MDQITLGLWPQRLAARAPHKVALVSGKAQLTYAQLHTRTGKLSRAFAAMGAGKGSVIAFCGANSFEFIETLFAAAALGAVFVPVNTRLAAPEIAHIISDISPHVIIHQAESAQVVADSARLAASLSPSSSQHPIHLVELGASYDRLLAGVGAERSEGVAGTGTMDGIGSLVNDGRADVDMDDPAVVLYTSGTTGASKGAVLTHSNLTWQAVNTLIDYDIASNDVLLLLSPLFHAAALGMGALPLLLKGGTIIVDPVFDAGRSLNLIETHRVTMLTGVPTTLQRISNHPHLEDTDLSSLRTITCGGAPSPLHVIQRYEARGIAFTQGYGMTECSPGVTFVPKNFTDTKQGSVGLPHFFTSVRVRSGGYIAPAGEIGEIEICGPNVFHEYLGLPDATAAAMTPDGYFASGDLGFVDEDGFYFIADRIKDMIISGAENIYPAEVEAVIHQMPGVRNVAVIGQPCSTWGEVPIAALTLEPGTHITHEDLTAFLHGKLARYKIPKETYILDQLPLTATGKVHKRLLREHITALHASKHTPPASARTSSTGTPQASAHATHSLHEPLT